MIKYLILLSLFCCSHQYYLVTRYNQNIHQCYLPIPVVVYIDTPEPMVNAVKRALSYWNSVDSRTYFIYMGKTDYHIDSSYVNGLLPIQIVSPFEMWDDIRDNGSAKVEANPYSGCVLTNKIKISANRISSVGKFESTLLHELGHVLGLEDMNKYGGSCRLTLLIMINLLRLIELS